MTSIKNSLIVKKFQAAMATGDWEKAFNYLDQHACWHSDNVGAPWSGVHSGIDAIRHHFKAITQNVSDFERHIDQLIDHDNLVIEIGHLSCKIIKSNQPFKTNYVCLYEVKNNKITNYRILEDSLHLYNSYFNAEKSLSNENEYLDFEKLASPLQPGDYFKVISKEEIDSHFPAPPPGAIKLFIDKNIHVGMVKTETHQSFPHKNKADEVHYVITGHAKFRAGEALPVNVSAGDVVYVKFPVEHEWFDCSSDFELIFIQAGEQ